MVGGAEQPPPVEADDVVGLERRVAVVGSGALRAYLRPALAARGVEVVAEASTVDDLHPGSSPWSGVIVGPSSHGVPECDVVELRSTAPAARVIVLTPSLSDIEFLAVIQAGAVGYLLVDAPPDHVAAAVVAALEGELAVPRQLVGRLAAEFASGLGHVTIDLTDDRTIELSDREWEVVCLLRQGRSTREVADRLYVSAATVRSHIASIVHKLGASDRTEALRILGSS